ncbi:MAG: cell envelope biosis protein OmpA [Myxococcales bacterium]|nr:cell envelope biosis protein OmpA [Myxococcales bacterium]
MRGCTLARLHILWLAAMLPATLAFADGDKQPADDDAPSVDPASEDAPPPETAKPKKKKKKHHKKAVDTVEAAPVEAEAHETIAEHEQAPPRVMFAGELLGATPVDGGNRKLFGAGGGASLGADVFLTPIVGIHGGAMLVYLGKDAGMSSTTWIAGHLGPRIHFGEPVFGEATHNDAWVDAHVTYGSSGGIRRPGFDLGAAVEWEVSPGLRLGPMLRYEFGSDPRASNAQLFTIGLAVGYGGRGRSSITIKGDTDGDGISDLEDNCPDEPAGPNPDPMREGCPTSDHDGDGVLDAEDLCPNEAAGKHQDPSRAGCPFTDSDGDKIADADDKCPTQAGPPNPFDPARHGCPELARVEGNKIEILQQIFFQTDSATIKEESVPVLEAVAVIMKTLADARIRVEGHTDDKGTDEYNLDLSKRRARSVAQWLVVNGGINANRLETEGYGKSRPIVSGTAVDTGQNRRVEFVILDSK